MVVLGGGLFLMRVAHCSVSEKFCAFAHTYLVLGIQSTPSQLPDAPFFLAAVVCAFISQNVQIKWFL
jgi:hypothetical protein